MSTINLLREDSDTILDIGESVVFIPPAKFPILLGATFGSGYYGYPAKLTVRNFDTDGVVFVTDKFLLTDLHESQACRQAPVFVMNQTLMYTSGITHSIGVYNGQFLINQSEQDSRSDFERIYHEFLKSDSCLNRPDGTARYVQLTYRDQVRKGYILSLEFNTVAAVPNSISFSFSMFIYSR